MIKIYTITSIDDEKVRIISYNIGDKSKTYLDMTMEQAVRFAKVVNIDYVNAEVVDNSIKILGRTDYDLLILATIESNSDVIYLIMDKHMNVAIYTLDKLFYTIIEGKIIQNSIIENGKLKLVKDVPNFKGKLKK